MKSRFRCADQHFHSEANLRYRVFHANEAPLLLPRDLGMPISKELSHWDGGYKGTTACYRTWIAIMTSWTAFRPETLCKYEGIIRCHTGGWEAYAFEIFLFPTNREIGWDVKRVNCWNAPLSSLVNIQNAIRLRPDVPHKMIDFAKRMSPLC